MKERRESRTLNNAQYPATIPASVFCATTAFRRLPNYRHDLLRVNEFRPSLQVREKEKAPPMVRSGASSEGSTTPEMALKGFHRAKVSRQFSNMPVRGDYQSEKAHLPSCLPLAARRS